MRWFEQNAGPGVTVRNLSDQLTGFQIAGPNARRVLDAVTRDATDLTFLDVRTMTIGMVSCLVQRVSFTGGLGYEIYCEPVAQRQLWHTLWEAGQAHGMRPFGMRAMMSLRLDKFFGAWLSEFSPDYTPAETGMDRFIAWSKNVDFIGRAAAEAERAVPPDRLLCPFEVLTHDADVHGYEPIWIDGAVQGFCTSGGYSHHAGKSIALGLIPRATARDGMRAQIEILGEMCDATLITTPLYDADGAQMRG
jgi:dimethylglycine dehydrogenase